MNIFDLDRIYNELVEVKYKFDDYLKITYITEDQYRAIQNKMSILRKARYFDDPDDWHKIMSLFKFFYKSSIKRNYLIRMQPRFIAQRFLAKKNVRQFIFKRDGYKCLKCGSKKRVQLDHINPVSRGGENKLSNLQTLCGTCNTIKSDRYFDYRNNIKNI